MKDYLMLRTCLCCGCMCFVLFGCINPAGVMPDTVVYNSCMVLINGYFILVTIWQKRHIDFPREWEQVYGNHFENIGLSRHKFAKLVAAGLSRTEKSGGKMHDIGDTVTSLCIIVDGEIVLMDQAGKQQQLCVQNDILEANEWILGGMNPHTQRFVYRYVAVRPVLYVKWTRESLVRILKDDQELSNALRSVLGIATARSWCRLGGARHDLHNNALSPEMKSAGYHSYPNSLKSPYPYH